MNYDEAIEMDRLFELIGGFSEIKIHHHGFWSKMTPEIANDGRWQIELWSRKDKIGTRTLTQVKKFEPSRVASIARGAKTKAKKDNKAATARKRGEQGAGW